LARELAKIRAEFRSQYQCDYIAMRDPIETRTRELAAGRDRAALECLLGVLGRVRPI
jgi:hypothetical protein